MVAPITGPYSKTLTPRSFGYGVFASQQSFIGNRSWYRQRQPYTLPLTFNSSKTSMEYMYGANIGSPVARPVNTGLCWISIPAASSSNAYNMAWSDFDSKVRGQAGWAVTLLQYRQTYDSLVNNVTDLYHVFRDIKQLRFDRLYRRFKPPKGFKMKGKTFANRVLEWRFGWQPLWNDIHDTAAQLGRSFDPIRVIGKGSANWNETSSFTLSGRFAQVVETRKAKVFQAYRLQADVVITNPNMLLLDSAGLANPALVAYEMIPFSFVLNYFLSLEEYLRGLSPYMGLTLSNPCTTAFAKTQTTIEGRLTRMSYSYPNPGPYGVRGEAFQLVRTPGSIAGPKLRLRDPWILSPARGLTSVSLLLQQLAKR